MVHCPPRPEFRHVARFAPVLAVALLAGCATLPTRATLDGGDAAVVVSVTTNLPRGGRIKWLWLERVKSPDPEASKARMPLAEVTGPEAQDTGLFVASLGPGTYEVHAVGFEDNSSVTLTAGGRAMLGQIELKRGQVHDLGRLVITGLNADVLVGRSRRASANPELIARFAPTQAAIFQGAAEAGWTTPPRDGDRVEAYALNRPVGLDGVVVLPGGRLAAAGRLGTVFLRGEDGRWSAWRTGALDTLRSLHPIGRPGDALVAAGEVDGLWIFDQQGRARRAARGNLPAGNLVFVTGSDAGGWVVAHRHGQVTILLRSARLEDGDWQPIAGAAWSEPSVWLRHVRGGFVVVTGSGGVAWFDDRGARRTDGTAPPEVGTLVDVVVSGDETLGLITGKALGGRLFLTRDGGRRWQELASPFSKTLNPPVVLPSGRLILVGGFASLKPEVSDDGGKTWQAQEGEFPAGATLQPVPGGLLAVFDGRIDFGIVRVQMSKDEGRTWWTEYTTFDSEAYRSTKAK